MGFGLSKIFGNRYYDRTREILHLKKINDVEGQNETIEQLMLLEIIEQSNKFENLEAAYEWLSNFEIDKNLIPSKNAFLFKFDVDEVFDYLHIRELNRLAVKMIKFSTVMMISSKNDEKFAIHWKSERENYFLTFKPYESYFMSSNKMIYEYIVKFILNALVHRHPGIVNEFIINPTTNEVELNFLEDHRKYNILLSAVEERNIPVLKNLLQLHVSMNSDEQTAQSLAYEREYYDILLILLNANATYPNDINFEKCSDEIKEFKQICDKLHKCIIKKKDSEKIEEIIRQKRNLRYFYNEFNVSAASVALKSNLTDIYEILLKNELTFGPDENMDEIMQNLSDSDKKTVRELHVKYAKPMPEKYINVIMANTHVGHDVDDEKQKFKLIENAYHIINNNQLIRTILMIVAASKTFTVIFDFNHDAVNILDPKSNPKATGIFYTCGRIFIGAKGLLEKRQNEVLGVMAHEFCHYALNLTYKNKARPYKKPIIDFPKSKFSSISDEIKKNWEEKEIDEEIVSSVYEKYPQKAFHPELAVRVPHMLAQYHDDPEKIEESRENFKELFDYMENKVGPEMDKEIPKIKSIAESVDETKLSAIAFYNTKAKKMANKNPTSFCFILGLLFIALVSLMVIITNEVKGKISHTAKNYTDQFEESSTEDLKDLVSMTTTKDFYESSTTRTSTMAIDTTSTTKFLKMTVDETSISNKKDYVQNIQCGTRKFSKGFGTVIHGEYPWNAALIAYKIGFICGGTLVSNKHVVTAAHCIQGKYKSHAFGSDQLSILLGFENRTYPEEQGRITVNVKSIKIHPDWNVEDQSYDADIAVLELEDEIQFGDFIRPICITDDLSTISQHLEGIIVGFVSIKSEKLSEKVKKFKVTITSYQECFKQNQINQNLASPRMFCVSPPDEYEVSYANSGGGIYVLRNNKFYLRGLVSATLPNNYEERNTKVIATDAVLYYDWVKSGGLTYTKNINRNISVAQDGEDFSQQVGFPDFSVQTYFRELERDWEIPSPGIEKAWQQNVQCGTRYMAIPLIYGGTTIKNGEFPWNVALIHNEHGLFCGGTIASNRHIVTAAFCLRGKNDEYVFEINDFTVLLGVHNHKEPEEPGRITMSVKSINIHEDYSPHDDMIYSNIAILELANEIKFTPKILPICLANKNSTVATAREGITVGFGITENNTLSDIANKLNVPIRNYHECIAESYRHRNFANPTTFCAGAADGSGVCSGDSGSGVYVLRDGKFYLRGLVSSSLTDSHGNCDGSMQAIFTDVPKYYNWFEENGVI